MPRKKLWLVFRPWEVRAALRGEKTQKRFLAKMGPDGPLPLEYTVGALLRVKEALVDRNGSWHYEADMRPITMPRDDPRCAQMIAWAHHTERLECPSVHMPQWAARLAYHVSSVTCGPLQSMSPSDALAEGLDRVPTDEGEWFRGYLPATASKGENLYPTAIAAFRDVWDVSVTASRSVTEYSKIMWRANPQVYTVRLEVADAEAVDVYE